MRQPPQIPPSLLDGGFGFQAAPDWRDWAFETFIDPASQLYNPDHNHLQGAVIGFLLTTVGNKRGGNRIVGQAEFGTNLGIGDAWARGKKVWLYEHWFGLVPDFVITLDAVYLSTVNLPTVCALVEHELYHCGQAKDDFGFPKFNSETNMPVFAMRGHDVEEFVGVVARYGAGCAAGQTRELVEAAKLEPVFTEAALAFACGTCKR